MTVHFYMVWFLNIWGLDSTECNTVLASLFEPQCEKTGLQGSDQVQHKPGCAATEDS